MDFFKKVEQLCMHNIYMENESTVEFKSCL